ncbi:hypothetical protein ACFL6U_12580 [Planctomycetota bacterium]
MHTKLEALILSLNVDKTITETFNRANHAINTFTWDKVQITDWDEYRLCMARFHYHVQNCVLRLGQRLTFSVEMEWDNCVNTLLGVYGPSGPKVGFERTRTGNEGGLNAVLRAIAMHMAEQYSGNEVSARVFNYWNQLTVEEQLAAPTEYLGKYGQYLPSELTESGAIRVRANFPKFLSEHPHLIQKLRQTVR